jgi:hypothetical protein
LDADSGAQLFQEFPMTSRHNVSRASTLLSGQAALANYQLNKNGIEWTPEFVWVPQGPRAVAFTGVLAAGALLATLSANWAGASGLFPMTLSSGEVVNALLTNGATTCTFWPASPPPTGGSFGPAHAILNAVTASATVGGQPPVLGVANAISVSASIAAAGLAVLATLGAGTVMIAGVATPAAIPDVPRNVIGAWTTASTVTVKGLDYYGQAQTETQTGSAFTGKKTFSAILSVSSSAAITLATFGTGNVLGLPFRVGSGGISPAMFNDATDAGAFVQPDLTMPATATTGDVRGTYAPAGALNGAKFLAISMKVYDNQSQVGAFGVTPA